MRKKDKTLYWVWKKYRTDRWGEKLKDVGVVSEEDVNGFLRLVKERDKYWFSGQLGYFVSLVLKYCYSGKEIHLDVDAVNGDISVGEGLDWEGDIYVDGTVDGEIGYGMERGTVVVKGDVKGGVGWSMKNGVIIVYGDVVGCAGYGMEDGLVVVNGCVANGAGNSASGGRIIINGDVKGYVGELLDGGEVVINGDVEGDIGISMRKGTIVIRGTVAKGNQDVGYDMQGGIIYIGGDVEKDVGGDMDEGVIIIKGDVKGEINELESKLPLIVVDGKIYGKKWMESFGQGNIVCNGFVYFGDIPEELMYEEY